MKRKAHAANAGVPSVRRSEFLFNFCLIILLTLVSFGCSRTNNAGNAPEIMVPVFAVNTTLVVHGQIQDHLSFTGDIYAGSTVDVFSDAAGRVAEIYVQAGSRVNRGDQIAAVDPSRPGMTFRHSIVRAPISGTVIALPAQIGQTVSQAVPIARLSGGAGLEVRLHVAERFVSKMALNLPCEITLDAWPGEVFQGSISELSPTIDLTSRTMEVRVNVSNTGSQLKAGMFAKVKIITEQKEDTVKIPASAIINRFGEQYVFVIAHERDENDDMQTIVRKRIVVPGIIIDGVAEILSGLEPDEEIVLRGQTLLDDGSRVNIIERMSPLSESGLAGNDL